MPASFEPSTSSKRWSPTYQIGARAHIQQAGDVIERRCHRLVDACRFAGRHRAPFDAGSRDQWQQEIVICVGKYAQLATPFQGFKGGERFRETRARRHVLYASPRRHRRVTVKTHRAKRFFKAPGPGLLIRHEWRGQLRVRHVYAPAPELHFQRLPFAIKVAGVHFQALVADDLRDYGLPRRTVDFGRACRSSRRLWPPAPAAVRSARSGLRPRSPFGPNWQSHVGEKRLDVPDAQFSEVEHACGEDGVRHALGQRSMHVVHGPGAAAGDKRHVHSA